MKVRAAIFDVYATILEVGPAPVDADLLWQKLFQEFLGAAPPLSRTEFSISTGKIIAHLHADARARGVPWPEIQWPAVVMELIPSLRSLTPERQAAFIHDQMQLGRSLRLAAGAAECLRWLHARGCLLGIASNSQAYTIQELESALSTAGLGLDVFDRSVRFWSFENGFSKPDPHAFRMITARLEARGILPAETLMIGDRLDNDIRPATAQGWQTWHLARMSGPGCSGNWHDLLDWLRSSELS